ncbi:DUF4123 domain-containing protein [Lysobacter koreensis]|uniref:DUF4123 domain-containing protein n=1 Tax=Lysobacter koreensis TaxID=266122 RepID=A0ABW2YNW6_9GAMM
MTHYLLFDGIQIMSTALTPTLKAMATFRIYDDLGEEAADVGPILVESDVAVEAWVADPEPRAPLSYAISRLQSDAPLESLGLHLRAIRYLHLTSYEQHFLRYADTRVLTSLMQVLSRPQKQGLLGPIQRWTIKDRMGNNVHHEKSQSESVELPLKLTSAQQLELLRLSRPDQLLAEVIADDSALAEIGSDAERHAWAREALEFLEVHRARSFPYRLAVGSTAVRTSGRALQDPGFARAVVTSLETGVGAESLFTWSPSPVDGLSASQEE